MQWAGVPLSSGFRTRGPVPGTVEIAPEHEIDTPAAVSGTDMEIGMKGVFFAAYQRQVVTSPSGFLEISGTVQPGAG